MSLKSKVYTAVGLVLLMASMFCTALSEKELYPIYAAEEGQQFGGWLWITETITEGKYIFEGRVVMRNSYDVPISYSASELCIFDGDQRIYELPAITVNPKSTPPGVYAVLTFSGYNVELPAYNDLQIYCVTSPRKVEEKESYLGLAMGYYQPSEYSDGGFMRANLSGMPETTYLINFIAVDENDQFVWAEDCSINVAYETEASKGIEDYLVRLFDEKNIKVADIYCAVYLK